MVRRQCRKAHFSRMRRTVVMPPKKVEQVSNLFDSAFEGREPFRTG
jgi:hypothetical protein